MRTSHPERDILLAEGPRVASGRAEGLQT
jgi:hypothetical protein